MMFEWLENQFINKKHIVSGGCLPRIWTADPISIKVDDQVLLRTELQKQTHVQGVAPRDHACGDTLDEWFKRCLA